MYDPMIAKLIVWDEDREKATARMLRALAEYEVGGLTTLIPFHQTILATKQWAKGETCRDLTEDKKWLKTDPAPVDRRPPARRRRGRRGRQGRPADYQVEVGGKLFDVKVIGEALPVAAGGGGAGLRSRPSASARPAAAARPRATPSSRRFRATSSRSRSRRARRSPRATWSA